ncbi:YceI family protein [Microbacterium stercoris]|uniref:YceI family protein n=1 Tax=Microbacterium stercoris TaxID=2820289 RepID=A0A939QPR3_9MICO|nr:YceI family protein [Microbacterium stercoris]MBO3662708.1 YceI family protein [Microbacterium stercoris]
MSSPSSPRRLGRRGIIWIVVAVVALLAGAALVFGPAFYRDVIVGEAPPAPTVGAGTPTPEGTEAGDEEPASDPLTELDGSWTASEGSFAGYRVDEVLNGTDVTVVGRTEEVTADVTVADLTVTEGSITVDVGSIATDEGARDAYFRDNALEVEEFPTATFTLTEPITGDVPESGTVTTQATGELTLHGVTREVTADVQVAFDGRTAEVAGSIPITFEDYGVQAPSLGFVSVEPEGFVEFHLVLDKSE